MYEGAFLSMISGVTGVALGGVITWVVSKHFYIKASTDLEKQTKILIELNEIIAGFLESQDIKGLSINRGKDGLLSGIIYQIPRE